MMHGPPEPTGNTTQINHLFDPPNPDAARRPNCPHWWPVVYEVEGFLIDICPDCQERMAMKPIPRYHDEEATSIEAPDAPEAYEDATDSNHPFP